MVPYIVSRLLWGAAALLGITLVVFIVVHLSGDPAALYTGPEGTKQDYEILRTALGFDRPWPEQYERFLVRAVRGDFGRSLRHKQPALPMVLGRFPATLALAVASMLLAASVALPLGVVAALRRNSALDTNDRLYHELDGMISELKLVGDAYSPRRIHDAILDGTRAARAL